MDAEQKRARGVLDDLLQCDEGLRSTDISFIDDMNTRRHLTWSEGQIGWLDDIYKRVC